MGRPRKYAEGPARFTLVLNPADKVTLESFTRWFAFKENRNLGIAEALLAVLRRSKEFSEFEATGQAAGPMFAQAPLLLSQKEVALPVPAVQAQAPRVPEPVKALPVATQPKAPPVPVVAVQALPVAQKALLAEVEQLRNDLRNCGLSGSEIAVRAGINKANVNRFLAGEQTPKAETLAKLAAIVEERREFMI